ncbi:MAG TPA: polyprenyl synthetase family protein [Chitinispirillaceae bacterium]|nr:polyprenyl synthetase family protein [Chitinispirillaceae bacterium]
MVRTGLQKRFPDICNRIEEYCLRDGKRIRSTLFIMEYMENAGGICDNLFACAASLELLHLFALIQDDVIDKSKSRRGGQSLHKILEMEAKVDSSKKAQDLSIVFSDILYSTAVEAFLKVGEHPEKKERALKTILDAAVSTGSGQFMELIYSSLKIDKCTLDDIYEIYDQKTARYTFCGPLVAGAQLAGASETKLKSLNQAGLFLGRAYQISDDLSELSEDSITVDLPSDITECRKTILMWHLYNCGKSEVKELIGLIQSECDLQIVMEFIEQLHNYGSFEFALNQRNNLINEASSILSDSSIQLKNFLSDLFDRSMDLTYEK